MPRSGCSALHGVNPNQKKFKKSILAQIVNMVRQKRFQAAWQLKEVEVTDLYSTLNNKIWLILIS